MLKYEAVLLRQEHLAVAGASRTEMTALIDDFVRAPGALDRPPSCPTTLVRPGRADLLVSLDVADLAPAAAVYAFRLVRPGEALRTMRHPEV